MVFTPGRPCGIKPSENRRTEDEKLSEKMVVGVDAVTSLGIRASLFENKVSLNYDTKPYETYVIKYYEDVLIFSYPKPVP